MQNDKYDIDTTFKYLKKSSKFSLTFVVLGAFALVGSIIYSGIVLTPLENEIKSKTDLISKLEETEKTLNEKIQIERQQFDSLKTKNEKLSAGINSMTWEQKALETEIISLRNQLSHFQLPSQKLTLSDFKINYNQSIPPCEGGGPVPVPVPIERENGLKNLSLLRTAIARSSSVLPGYPWRHRTEYLNDGWYNNCRSWIPATTDSQEYAEIDLGGIYEIHGIAFGSEHTSHFSDRAAVAFDVLIAKKKNDWHTILTYDNPSSPIRTTRTFLFPEKRQAQYLRLVIKRTIQGQVRIDEFEVLGNEASIN